MAKKKTKKKTNKKAKKRASNMDLAVVAIIILSILLCVLIYGNSGIVGVKLNEILGGMMGIIKYILPIGTFLIGIKLALDDDEYLTSKLTQYTVLLISVAVLMSAWQINSGEMSISNKTMQTVVKEAYNLGTQDIGGGALGVILAMPLSKLLSPIGAIILCVGVVIMLAVFTFGINISEIINNFVEKTEENREEKYERRQQLREEQKKARMEAKQESIENRKKAKELQKEQARREALEEEDVGEQIKINFGGRILEEDDKKGRKKYDHSNDDLTPLTKETKKTQSIQPDVIENNLFRQEEEKKEDKTKEVLQLEHAMVVEDENYEYPPIELLSKPDKKKLKGGAKALTDTATKLQKTLYSFGVSAKVENVSVGPAITRYELKPAEGVRVSKIANLADDIALNLAAETIRIEAPIPGKQAVGIEVPNKEKEAVHLREVLESEEFQNNKSKLTVALGKDVAGNIQLADIAKMPHVLIAGSTGSGKSVCINTIISSIIYNAKPSEVKMVMVDPKVVELSVYNGVPHLLCPVVTDPKKASVALNKIVAEMERRYEVFEESHTKNIATYNSYIDDKNKDLDEDSKIPHMPYIVVIVDELADLMLVASKDVEAAIMRITQMARAAGIHLIIATQRPSTDVITGVVKANIPSRISFAVSSGIDSRTILDSTGAEKLLGKGDMLFLPMGEASPQRIQGAFIADDEIKKIIDYTVEQQKAEYDAAFLNLEASSNMDKSASQREDMEQIEDDDDELYNDVVTFVVEQQKASASLLQRRFKVGYNRAARIIDLLEERGIIGPANGSKPREVLVKLDGEEE